MPLYLTVYPDPHPEVTSVDGNVKRVYSAGESFTALRTGAGTGFSDTAAYDNIAALYSHSTTGNWWFVARGIFLFDTSAMGAGAVPSAAVLSLYGYSKADYFSQSVCVGSSNPASNTALAATDYDYLDFGTADFANRITFAAWATGGAENAFTLNSNGLAAIVPNGITKLATRSSADMDNSAPAWQASLSPYAQAYFADQAGTAQDPKLYITYTAGGGGTAHEGAAAITLAITTAGAGLKGLYGAAASTLTLTTAAAGKKALYGAGTALLSLTTAASGLKTLLGAATATLTLTTAAAGLKTLHGAGTALLELFTSGAGKKALYGAGTALLTLTASAALEVASLLPYAPTVLEVFITQTKLITMIDANTVVVTLPRTTQQIV